MAADRFLDTEGLRLLWEKIKALFASVPEYTIEKLGSAETGYSSSYVLKKDNVQVGATINIPKDMVVSNGEVKTVTVADEPYQGAQVGDKYVDLTIANTSQNHIYIPVKDLVDVYVAGNGIDISQNNYISVKIDSVNANGLTVGGSGLALYQVTPSINGEGGSNGSMLATDKEKLDKLRLNSTEVILNGRSGSSGIQPWSLCAFAFDTSRFSAAIMYMTSFTATAGQGGGAAITGYAFPIGCKIYYHPDTTLFTASTDFTSKKFYSSYDDVDGRYSSNTGVNLSLSSSTSSSVYLRVDVDVEAGYWRPYHKSGETYENIVTSDDFIADSFYIYLGKTVGSAGYKFQLEDNNILYYFDGDDLIDWATYIANVGSSSVLPSGGTTGQVLAKASDADNDVEWVNQSAGVTDYDELDDKPQINGVTLSGNKTSSQLGVATSEQGERADTAIQSLTVGTTTTGQPNTNASVTNSGTQTYPVLDFVIPRGADGQDGQNGADAINPFKGWFTLDSQLLAEYPNPSNGDYAYVQINNDVIVYQAYDGYWIATSTTFNPSNNQEFASGEKLNMVHIDKTLEDSISGDVPDAKKTMLLKDSVGYELDESKIVIVTSGEGQNVFDGYIKSKDGSIVSYSGTSYCKIETTGFSRIRFVGLLLKKMIDSDSGFAFTDENDSLVASFTWDVDINIESTTTKEYLMDIPEGAKYFKATCKSPILSSYELLFRVYLMTDSLSDRIDYIYGKTTLLNSARANDYSTTVKGAMTSSQWYYSSSGKALSYRIDLDSIRADGYTKLHIIANPFGTIKSVTTDYSILTFTTSDLGSSTISGNNLTQKLSSIMNGELRLFPRDAVYDLSSDTESKFLYVVKITATGNTTDDLTPSLMLLTDEVGTTSPFVKTEDVIDNLLSTANDKPLSAKQGKILNDKISSFNPAIEEHVVVVVSGEGQNVFDGEVDKNSGNILSIEGYKYFKVDVTDASKVRFLGILGRNNNWDSGYCFTNENDSVISYYAWDVDTSMSSSIVKEYVINVPNGAKYFKTQYLIPNYIPELTSGFYCFVTVGTTIDDYIDERLQSVSKLEIAQPPIPPSTYSMVFSNGSFISSQTVLTTARIYGDFLCNLNDGYIINKVMRVDKNGDVVNHLLVETDYPLSVMDWIGSSTPNIDPIRTQFGIAYAPPQYGVIIEIKKNDNTFISKDEKVFKNFWWINEQLVSELSSLPRFCGDSYTDSNVDSERVYSKSSVSSYLHRMKVGAMVDWKPLRQMRATSERQDTVYYANSIQTGIPYSRANIRDKWFGIHVSPETFVSSMMNPYSTIYTERIGTSGNDYRSEYGVTYGSEHGVPYYGLVCSSYCAFSCGFKSQVNTDEISTDSRFYNISKHGSGSGLIHAPVNVNDIPSMCIDTNPNHTTMIVDFLRDSKGNRVAAIVAEETYPNIKVSLYTVDRLQKRFDYSYERFGGSGIDSISIIKPSNLDSNRNVNLWNTDNLYSIGQFGITEPMVEYDKNVMFYMGEKAVVMQYNNTDYEFNDKQWLIVKTDAIYTKIKIERLENDSWFVVQQSLDIATLKQSYSDNNTNYFKIDVTSYCSSAGKYRACLHNENSLSTGFTHWIVLNGEIYIDSNDNNKVKWSSSNASASWACFITNQGQPYGQNYEPIGYVTQSQISSSSQNYFKVNFECEYGVGRRVVAKNKIKI